MSYITFAEIIEIIYNDMGNLGSDVCELIDKYFHYNFDGKQFFLIYDEEKKYTMLMNRNKEVIVYYKMWKVTADANFILKKQPTLKLNEFDNCYYYGLNKPKKVNNKAITVKKGERFYINSNYTPMLLDSKRSICVGKIVNMTKHYTYSLKGKECGLWYDGVQRMIYNEDKTHVAIILLVCHYTKYIAPRRSIMDYGNVNRKLLFKVKKILHKLNIDGGNYISKKRQPRETSPCLEIKWVPINVPFVVYHDGHSEWYQRISALKYMF